jgi:predicted MFS family arabinose efflux permease
MDRGGLLRHRDFRLLWGGETVSELGSQVSLLALPLVAVNTLSATPFQMGALAAASTAAFLAIGLPAGVWVDRLRRRRVMIASDLGRLLALGSIPVAYALGVLHLSQLYVVALATGVFTVFFDVAYQSYLPSLVGRQHLVEGNAKLTGSEQVAQIAGPSLAGGLVQTVGGPYAVALDAASFLVSAVAVGAIRTGEPVPTVPKTGRPTLRQDISQGLRFVFCDPLLRAITATTGTSNFFSGIQTAVEVIFLVKVVHANPAVIGLVFAAGGVGGVLAAIVASPVARWIGGARATLISSFAVAGGLLIPLATPGIGVLFFAVGLFLSSFAVVVYNINQVSFRQRLCPDRMLGRMNATIRFVVHGILPIGALAGGAIGMAIGLRPTLWVAMAGEALAGFWLLASPIRHMKDFPSSRNE